jgi:hypothetical protein
LSTSDKPALNFHILPNSLYIIIKFGAVYRQKQLLAHGRWFSPGTPASSTTKTGRHDIAEILLKVTLKHKKSNQSINQLNFQFFVM